MPCTCGVAVALEADVVALARRDAEGGLELRSSSLVRTRRRARADRSDALPLPLRAELRLRARRAKRRAVDDAPWTEVATTLLLFDVGVLDEVADEAYELVRVGELDRSMTIALGDELANLRERVGVDEQRAAVACPSLLSSRRRASSRKRVSAPHWFLV